MKLNNVLLAAGSVCLLLTGLPAQADTLRAPAAGARGVYLNGKVYRVLRDGGSLSMQISTPQYPDTPYAGNTVVPDPASPVHSSYSVLGQIGSHSYGTGIAVFNNRIYYAYTNEGYNNIGTYVATFDPYAGSWVNNRFIASYGYAAATGAALSVLNGTIYLFTGFATFYSTNPEGGGWTTTPTGPVASFGYQPLDAVTIYPQNSPAQVLIVLGKQPSNLASAYYSELDYVTWSGTFGAALTPAPISRAGQIFSGETSLQMGTAYRAGLGLPGFTGVKSPAAQLFAVQLPATNVLDRGPVVHFEYDVEAKSWKQDSFNVVGDSGADLWTYNWYDNNCDIANPATQGLHQFIVVNYLFMSSGSNGSPGAYGFNSDYLVPQNRINPITCTDTGGTNTPTGSMALDIARHYWTLVGVVLGSPPFAVNHLPATNEIAAQDLSNLDYAKETTIGVSHSQEWGKQYSMSAGLEVSAGFFGVGEVSNSIDIGYKHAEDYTHESESTGTVGHKDTMGTNTFRTEAAPPGDSNLGLGHYGWALFNAPMIKVQDYAVYSYDYNFHDGTGGVYLNQDLTMISGAANQGVMKVYAFDLNNPSDGDIPGLMANMPGVAYYPGTQSWGFPYSTDLTSWSALEWESNSSPWEVKLGRGTYTDTVIDPMGYGGGHNPEATFTRTQKDVTSSGETTSLSVDNTTSLSAEMGGIGIKATLKIGAESSFKTTTTDTTEFTQDVTAAINMGPCGLEVEDKSDCIKLLEVQPFILRATNAKAPWIPERFQGQKPWAITWTVDTACTETAVNCPGLTGLTSAGPHVGATSPNVLTTFGRSLPPRTASGRIVSGQGGGDPGDPLSHYSLNAGRLSWVDSNGAETRIPMTADAFVPSQGVSFQIGGFSWSSLGADGGWNRAGNVWTFGPGGNVQKDRVILKLDFDQATFNLQIDKVDFQGSIPAGVGEVPMKIVVNGLYSFNTILHHDFDVTWQLIQPPKNNTSLQLTSFDGRYNNANGSGKMTLAGTLPAVLPNFGDLELKMNDHQLLLPLLSMDGFREAYAGGGDFKYVKEGLNLDLNFANRTWSVTLNNQAFQKLLALRWGHSEIALNVGGVPWYNQDNAIVNFTASLTLHN